VLEHEDGGDAADQADPAADREVDLPRQQDHEHAERQGTGDGKLNHQLREIARAEKRGLPEGEERADRDQRDGHGEGFSAAWRSW
jgi:hypothetical protein